MRSIERLPQSIRNSMRSGIILFDLTRVMEELIFNSLDAGATKVSVYVGVGTCYVKVEDDGCGISRDGLALLGERYVTSKFPDVAETSTAITFGFRGEALASISDVSLLEIVTKARGMPNGYRKVLKGSKCLYLGVNDDRKDVGTTVIVRDLFYNQPVRRKNMQSSLKKVLDLVKKCVLQIALVHSKVCFVVVDIESEDELLCTRFSSSLSLLMSVYGIDDSKFLHELNISGGVLKLSGYISGPFDSLTTKAFQYVYINSRFVCKGPIHKLLNQLATGFGRLDPWEVNSISQKGTRSKPQACPAYVLNISCPRSLYDLTFEPSKTYVEFKDWIPILNFIEDSIQHLWRENMTDKSSSHASGSWRKDETWKEDLSEFAVKKSETQKHKPSRAPAVPMLTKEVDHRCSVKSHKVPFEEFCVNVSERETDTEFLCQSDCSLQSWNGLVSEREPQGQKIETHLLTLEANSFLQDNYFLEDRVNSRERSYDHVSSHVRSLDWQDEFNKTRSMEVNESSENSFSMGYNDFSDELEVSKKPFLQICSSRRSLPLDRSYSSSVDDLEFPFDDLKSKRRRVCSVQNSDMIKIDTRNCRFDTSPAQLETLCPRDCLAYSTGNNILEDADNLLGASEKSLLSHGNPFAKGVVLGSGSIDHSDNADSFYGSNSKWCSLSSDALFQSTAWDAAHVPDKGNYGYNIASNSSGQHNFVSGCTSTMLDFKDSTDTFSVSNFKDYTDTSEDIIKYLKGDITNDEFSFEHSDKSICETEWLPLDLHSRGDTSDDKYESHENQFRCQNRELGERCKRSQSAPPFYRHKKRFISLSSHHSIMKEGNAQLSHKGLISPAFIETDGPKPLDFLPKYAEDLTFCPSPKVENEQAIILDMKENKKGLLPAEIQESTDSGTKWRNGCEQIAEKYASHVGKQHNILDISSGLLHLAGNSLVPQSIHKKWLEDAKVLHQVDKKFIPIVASGTLAIIDQHAADERIQLEELRQKVLFGEAKTVSYLDAEKELTLPEIGYQLLQNYAGQIREWGWICDIQAPGSCSFKKNLNILHQQPAVVTLLGVPCILGVKLSDSDLLEFLEQLADTDGSSTIPPSVLRVLNYKACRGAIMFGDSLLPSECALIVEELKQTSLCFQCAHGRPTTVPVVKLEELHKQIAKLKLLDGSSSELWHGLQRQQLTLERAAQRLSMARG
ncbi:DNA mismatch repair protein MLH3 isoform X2 [Euphorbia lathyris]|uniref:DNA mismatch repair protein MLH3 isoform X2 n=1 Tax=Euphorbia lathyris TaxID=212925 RepID=UPI0033134A15